MTFLTYLLTVIEILVCLLLVGVVLIQKTRSHGGGLAFGAGMGEQLFGAQTGNVLTRATVILASIFLVNTLVLSVIGARRGYKSVVSATKAPAVQRPLAPTPRSGAPAPAAQPVSVPDGAAVPAPTPVAAPLPAAAPSASPVQTPGPATTPSGGAAPAGAPTSG